LKSSQPLLVATSYNENSGLIYETANLKNSKVRKIYHSFHQCNIVFTSLL